MSTPINDGGPAFPVPIAMGCDGGIYNTMEQSAGKLGGMTLRDWFAGQSLGHIPELLKANDRNRSVGQIAQWAYCVADAMLAERAKEATK